jgi:RNA polymerase sigma-70 factor (ECF subfamily)
MAGDERELVDGLHRDDPGALAALVDRYGDRIYNHCFRLLAHWADAEDATLSVFLEIWRHRRRVQLHEGSALPSLSGAATNVCRNASRSRRRYLRAVTSLPAARAVPDHSEQVAERLGSEARMRGVLSRIEALPEREREVLGLVAWAGLSYKQAAAALDVPVGTVRSRLSRARARLTQEVSDD